jgi:transcriptional regulator with XRE-family HTH domain
MEKIDLFKNFRKNLELLRIERSLSTEELSVKLGLKKYRIIDLEYGKHGRGIPKAKDMFDISTFFGVTAEDLVHKKAKVVLS